MSDTIPADIRMPLTSQDVVQDRIDRLRELIPEAFAEGKIDFDKLRQVLGDGIDAGRERYGLTWAGKADAIRAIQSPSVGTLVPRPEESVNFDTTENLFIEGDNLEVLKLLQKSYYGKVKMIYIDPPYNTGNEFIYPDNYREGLEDYLRYSGQVNDAGVRQATNTETSGRYHSKWLTMMYPRLFLARNLLREDGVMFVSIDEHEYSSLRLTLAEVFGEENLMGTIVWKNATDNNPTNIATEHEYILVVARAREALEAEWKSAVSDVKDVLVRIGKELTAQYNGNSLKEAYELWYRQHKSELWPLDRYKYIDAGGVFTGSQSVHNPGREGYRYDVIHPVTKKPCKQPLLGYRFPKETMDGLLAEGRVLFGDDENKIIELKLYASEYQEKLSSILELDGRLGVYDLREDFPDDGKVFNNPKPIRLLTTFFPLLLKSDGDIALDFFAGSGVTGKAIYALNANDGVQRRFVLVQLPEPLDREQREHKAAFELCARNN